MFWVVLKNAPSEFQNIMNEIFNPFMDFMIIYIDDALVFWKDIDQHWKQLNVFKTTVKREGLVVSASKMLLFQTKIRFLGFEISQGKYIPVDRAIAFANKFPNKILDQKQLHIFMGSVNYISDFYKDLADDAAPLYKRLN